MSQALLPGHTLRETKQWTSDHWATPRWLIEQTEAELGKFDLDACAEDETAKAPVWYTQEQNGLAQPWYGRVWLNPPYSNVSPWLEKAVEATKVSGEASLVVALLPAATDTGWFHDLVLPWAEVRFLRRRIRFIGWQGTPVPHPKSPNLLALYWRTVELQ